MNGMDKERYARQMILPEIGEAGQAKIRAASVLVIGAGGLGSPALMYLAAAGVGRLGIADFDVVEVSNLQRQVIYDTADAGRGKAEAAAERLRGLNPDIDVEVFAEGVNAGTIAGVMAGYDVVIDGTDNFAAKFLINDACVKFGKILIYGALSKYEGQVCVFDTARGGACYRCLFPHPPKEQILNCAEAGILGPAAGIIGVTQAMQALLVIVGDETFEPLVDRLWVIDVRTMRSHVIEVSKDAGCSVCSKGKEEIVLMDDGVMCGDIPVLAYEDMARDGDSVLIDVREVEEYAAGFIPAAVNIPLSAMFTGDGIARVRALAGRPVFYCRSGQRSRQAVEFCREMDIGNAACLAIDYLDWKE